MPQSLVNHLCDESAGAHGARARCRARPGTRARRSAARARPSGWAHRRRRRRPGATGGPREHARGAARHRAADRHLPMVETPSAPRAALARGAPARARRFARARRDRRGEPLRVVRRETPRHTPVVTAENRMVGFPYPKFMNAILDGPGAALGSLIAAAARRLASRQRRTRVTRGGRSMSPEPLVSSGRLDYQYPAGPRPARSHRAVHASSRQHLYSTLLRSRRASRPAMRALAPDDPRPLTDMTGPSRGSGPRAELHDACARDARGRLHAEPESFGARARARWN